MWFLGAVIGLALGAMTGSFQAAFVGALLGGACGALLKMNSRNDGESLVTPGSALEKKIEHIYQALGDIHWRLEKLEKQQGHGTSPMQRGDFKDVAAEAAKLQAAVDELAAVKSSEPAPVIAEAMPAAAIAAAEKTIAPPPAITQREIIAASVAALEKSVEGLPSSPASPPPVPTKPVIQPIAEAAVPAATAPAVSTPQAVPRTPPPAKPEAPEGPGFIDRLLSGNIIAKLGVLLLFFGVGFLLKFAYDRGMFPPELRLLGVALGAGAMLFLGKRLLEKNRLYALILMGGAMGLLYLDTFFALKNFALISPTAGFVLFFLLGVAMTLMAVKMDAKVLAVLGITGAFMSPILASTGGGSHVLLFSYYLLLNLFIFAVSWFKSWRALNLTGFIFTFAIAMFWGYSNYQPAYFSTVEPFLIAFFVLYLMIPIVFAHRQPPELKGFVDGTLMFGTPLSAAMMQAALTRGMGDNILAWSAAGVALFYGVCAFVLWRRQNMRVLAEAHLVLAVVFGTVAPYFAFDAYPTFAFWALEGAAIVWLGCRQDRPLARAFGLFVQFGAALYFLAHIEGRPSNAWFNSVTVGCALIAAAAWITAWLLRTFSEKLRSWEFAVEPIMLTWGCLWWLAGGVYAIYFDQELIGLFSANAAMKTLIFVTLSFLTWELIGALLGWEKLRQTHIAHLPITLLCGVLQFVAAGGHPLDDLGAIAWPLLFTVFFFIMHRQRGAEIAKDERRYGAGWLLMILIASWEAAWRYDCEQFVWVWAIALAGFVAAALRYRLREWPRLLADSDEKPATPFAALALAWALSLWFGSAWCHIGATVIDAHRWAAMLGYAAITALALEFIGSALQWRAMRQAMLVVIVTIFAAVLYLLLVHSHPGAGLGIVVWLTAFAVWLTILWRQERDGIALLPEAQSLAIFWLATLLAVWETRWKLDGAWQYACIGMVIAVAMAALIVGKRHQRWPIVGREPVFNLLGVAPLLVAAALWTLLANATSDGAAPPLPYVPLLNPLDLVQLALSAVAWFSLRETDNKEAMPVFEILLAIFAFFWVNGVLLRTMHHWADVPFEWHALMRSVVVQAAFSLLWTSTALVLMIAAGKRHSRMLWGAGFLLLGVVMAKLVLNDLGNTGTVARIVSFIGVGILLMVIGYVAPVPPKLAETNAE